MNELVIGNETSDHLCVKIVERTYPRADDPIKANCLNSRVEVWAGGFKGGTNSIVRADELYSLLLGIENLYRKLKGSAVLHDAVEETIKLEIMGDGRGHVTAKGSITDEPGTGNTLIFNMMLDQTHLPGIMNQIKTILGEFPVIGK